MSPQAGLVLVEEIAPRIRMAAPGCVRRVGADDEEEVIADGIAIAAKMLDSVERAGKQVTPGNIAYYALQHLKSGRRSTCGSRTDVFACGTQLEGRSVLHSFEEEVGYDPELDEAIRLGDLLACQSDDPANTASRNVDWEEFLDSHDYRYGVMVADMAAGKQAKDSAKACGVSSSCIHDLKGKLARDLRAFMGENAIADCLHHRCGKAMSQRKRRRRHAEQIGAGADLARKGIRHVRIPF